MGTPLGNEENTTPLTEIHKSILRLHKKIDYIFSLFILSSLFNNLINKPKTEGKNMENKDIFKIPTLEDMKKENQYEHPVLFESFTEINKPVLDTNGNIRGTKEELITKDLYTRNPVQIIESKDLNKIQTDYKRLEDKFDEMTRMFRMMMSMMEEQKKENQELRNEIKELKNTVSSQNNKIDAQAQEISKLNGIVLNQSKEIEKLNGTLLNQDQEIRNLNGRLDASEAKNKILIAENQSLKSAQAPILRISSVPTKRRKHEEIYTSDDDRSVNESDLETVPLSPRDAMGRKWNPITGMRDTFSIFTPRNVLLQEKQENALRRAAFSNEIIKVKRLLNENPSTVNGRGMPDSLCSLVRSFNDKTPLMLAAQEGNLDCVKTLIESGANVDLLDRDNFTALDYAQQNQHRDVSVFLIRQKAHNGVDIVEKEDVLDKMKLN